ncbi:MAG: EAL domain-containing protein [Gammaproteobacteria bacterium]|nr:EAL domain-containing protein [Gammaproteobacteria bacterium]
MTASLPSPRSNSVTASAFQVIAEGVESEEAESILARFGCDYIQGYYLSKPLPALDVIPWLDNFKRARGAATT